MPIEPTPEPTPVPAPRRPRGGFVAAGLVTLLTFGAAPVIGATAASMGPTVVEAVPLPPAPSAEVVWERVLGSEADTVDVPTANDGLASSLAQTAGEAAATVPGTGTAAAGATTQALTTRASGAGPTMLSAAARGTQASPPPPKAKKTRKKKCSSAADQPLIDEMGPQHYAIDRTLVKSYARSPGRLNDLGWSRPHEGSDGRKDGMYIGGVTCGSDLHQAGLRSGDVVHSVNGRKVKSYAQAFLVYQAVKNDDRIVVEITRRGTKRTLTYDMG